VVGLPSGDVIVQRARLGQGHVGGQGDERTDRRTEIGRPPERVLGDVGGADLARPDGVDDLQRGQVVQGHQCLILPGSRVPAIVGWNSSPSCLTASRPTSCCSVVTRSERAWPTKAMIQCSRVVRRCLKPTT